MIERFEIQTQELQAALAGITDSVVRRAGAALLAVMSGKTVVIEERITSIGSEVIIEETILKADSPQ